MAAEFNIQTHLIQMETRIREDIAQVGAMAMRAQEAADEVTKDVAALKQKVEALDGSIKWFQRGMYGAIVALATYVWAQFTGVPHS